MNRGATPYLAPMLLLALFLCVCTKDTTSPKTDTIAPARVTDLEAIGATRTTVTLQWSAVGDDERTGKAAQYDLRYAPGAIGLAAWDQATHVDGVPAPATAGEIQSFTVTHLQMEHTYHFAIRVADEVPNWSGVSNDAGRATLPTDTIPPACVTDLRVIASDEGNLRVAWTAVGDDSLTGTALAYDLRRSTDPINTDRDWMDAVRVSGLSNPKAAGEPESTTAGGLVPATTYSFAIVTYDDSGNPSGRSNLADGATGRAIPPAQITTLTVLSKTSDSITLGWTAVGDDSLAGTASSYDLRYAIAPIDTSSWRQATVVSDLPLPKAAGEAETFVIGGLPAGETYYVAIRACDDVDACGPISNVVSADLTAPARVRNRWKPSPR